METKLSKGIDLISYFQISYCVSDIKTYLILGHHKTLAHRSKPTQRLKKTLKAFYARQPPIIQ